LLTAHEYHHLAWSLTLFEAYVQEEPPTQHRYCNNAVIVELVAFVATVFQPIALNGHDTAQRWQENVEI